MRRVIGYPANKNNTTRTTARMVIVLHTPRRDGFLVDATTGAVNADCLSVCERLTMEGGVNTYWCVELLHIFEGADKMEYFESVLHVPVVARHDALLAGGATKVRLLIPPPPT